MKKVLPLLALLGYFNCFSQGITVDTSTYTTNQLINQVLINSPCVSGFGVLTKNGSDFGSTPSIGYFENLNPNFPITRGVVLSTGSVIRTPSPNNVVLSDGNTAWTGDADMEAALLAQGLTIRTINASFIEFDFLPKTPLFNFSFVFASEEYGTSQCNFSDSFAFLLKDNAGGSYVNLAVIPSTNTPISVTTIRNNLYNSNCPSANPTYFGAFNGSGFGPAINFNGQTIKMTAFASGLDVTHTYHIKIVIADGGNNVGYDSALFLEANTFSIGQSTLGPDYTIAATNTAYCPGATNLPTLNANPGNSLAAGTTFSWLNGTTPIASQTSSTLNLNTITPPLASGINTFSVIYKEPNCQPVTDQINVEIYPVINVINTIPTIYAACGSSPYSFNLESNTPIIIAANSLPAGTVITYHISNSDAVGNISPLSSPFPSSTVTLAGQTIYVRVNSPTSPCYVIKTFLLKLVPIPVISAVPPTLSACARNTTDSPPMANFILTAPKNSIVGTQSLVWNVISYYTSQADADANVNPLTITGTNVLLSIGRTLYVRLTNISNPNCYATTSFDLVVKPLALIDNITDKIVCASYTLPVLLVPGAVYSTLAGGLGTHPLAGDLITPVAPTNFINTYVSNTLNGCVNQKIFKVTKADLTLITPPSASYCNAYTLPALPYGKYYTMSGGTTTPGNVNLTGAALTRTNTTTLTTVTTYYVRFEDLTTIPACYQEQPFTITLIPFISLPTYQPIFSCNAYSLVPDANGGTYYTGPSKTGLITLPASIAATQTIYVYKETATTPLNCSNEQTLNINIGIGSLVIPGNVDNCSSYVLPAVTSTGAQYWSGPTGTGTQYFATNIISSPLTTMYYYIPGQSCTNSLPFTITNKLQPMPDILNPSPVCDVYILPAAITHPGSYWTGAGGTGTVRPVGFPILSNPPTNQTTIYYVEKDPTDSTCFVQDSFVVTVYPSPLVDAKPREVVTCNTTYVLDNLTNGEYYQSAGGPSGTNPILPAGYVFPQNTGATTIYVYNFAPAPNTCVSEYSINIDMYNTSVTPINDIYACNSYTLPVPQTGAHYYTLSGGPLVVGQIEKMPGTIITTNTSLFIYKENNVRIPCKDEDPFTVTILTTPSVNAIASVTMCDSYTLPPYAFYTASNGNVTHYYTLPGGPTVVGQVEKFPSNAITTTTTLYAYAEVGSLAITFCFNEKPMVITINHTPVITTIPAVYACNNYSLPAYTTIATTVGLVSHYYTLAGGPSTAGNVERLVGYNVTTPGLTTLYAYAETGTTPNCYSDKPLVITILTSPVVSTIPAVSACDTYSLPAYNTIASTVPVTHYYTLTGGSTVIGNIERLVGYPITTPGVNTVYAYAEVGTSATRICFDEKPLVITINSTPVISTIPAVYSCDVFSLPAYATIATTIGNVSHYYTMTGGTTTVGNIEKFVGNNILTPGLTTLYAYAETGTTPNCRSDKPLAITVLTTPVVTAITPVSSCDTYSLPAYSSITSTVPVTHYYTLPGGSTVIGNIDRAVGYAITTPGLNRVYAYAEAGTPATKVCFNEKPMAITINVTPTLAPVVSSSHCATENFTLSPLTVGAYYENALHTIPLISTTIAATKTIYVYASTGTAPVICPTSANFTVTIYNTPVFAPSDIADVNVCNQYVLPALITPSAKYYTGPNATGTLILPGTIYTAATQTIYVHAESGVSPVICPADRSLLINVFNVTEPLTSPNTNIYCGQYTLTPLAIGNYYTGLNGSGLSYSAGNSITISQVIHVFATASAPYSCSDDYSFNVQVIYAPTAFPIPLSERTVCDTDGTNDGLTSFNLTALTPTLLGTQTGPQFSVQYFATYANATATVGGVVDAGVSPITSIVADHNLTSIFYSISDNSAITSCKNINSIGVQLIVNELPRPSETMEPHAICIQNPASVPPVVLRNYTIQSNLSPMNYSFVWTDSLGAIVGNGSTLTVTIADTYSLIATSNSTGCSSTPFSTVVIYSQKPIVTYTVSDAFENNQIITVIATGIGDYEYQIDGSPLNFQHSPVFENQNFVLDHQIVVRDKNGCNDTVIIPVSAVVVNFPKLFTPNGDGWYDTWKIYGIDHLSNAKVSIYNRYGKLVAQLNPNSPGWDGTLNNAPVPADDYWFTISYVENGLNKEYKSHFSIRR